MTDAERIGALEEAIRMLRDETDPVLAAAELLIQNALGDDVLWRATETLRDAQYGAASRLNQHGKLARTVTAKGKEECRRRMENRLRGEEASRG